MTRTSAIFGVVSVLTAAIVGGVFIRQKIISDSLYWRAWTEANTRWKREIRGLEEDISTLESNISSKNKNKTNTEKTIEKYDEGVKKLVEDIKELEEKMDSSRYYSIPQKVVKIINKNFGRQGTLKEKIRKFTSEISEFDENLLGGEETNYEDKVDKLKKKIEEFSKILGIQKKKLKAYADRRIELYKQFKQYESKKEEKTKQKNNLEEKLNEDKNLLNKLNDLIKQLEEKLSEKTKELSFLKAKGPSAII